MKKNSKTIVPSAKPVDVAYRLKRIHALWVDMSHQLDGVDPRVAPEAFKGALEALNKLHDAFAMLSAAAPKPKKRGVKAVVTSTGELASIS